MNLLAPMSLAFLGLLPVIVLLYFLKLKRREEPVSSTYLWKRTIEDLRVNAPLQRLRQNLLLWLQLALLALLVLALARPALTVRSGGGRRTICLIDTSASMTATDVTPNRLEAAKRQAVELVDNMRAGDEMMLLGFDAKPTVLVPFTGVKLRLREAIQDLTARETGTDFAQAVELIGGLGAEVPAAADASGRPQASQLYLLSDGGFETEGLTDAPEVELHYVRIGTAGENVGITGIDARRSLNAGEEPQVFVRVENFGSREADVRLELYLEGRLFAARPVSLPAGASAPVIFSDPELKEGLVKVALAVEDDLKADNVAWLFLAPATQVRTLVVSPGNLFLDLALKNDPLAAPVFLHPEEFVAQSVGARLAAGEFDVAIFDRWAPPASSSPERPSLPPGAYLFLGVLPPIEGFVAKGEVEQPVVLDWDALHPVNQYVTYGNLFVERALAFTGPPGTHTLVDSDAGPLVAWWGSAGQRVLVVGFDMFASRWPLRVSFPLFLANALRFLGGVEAAGGTAPVRPGSALSFQAPVGVKEVTVTYPDGVSEALAVLSGRVTFGDTYRTGPYVFTLGDDRRETRVVDLLDRRESDIKPRDAVPWQAKEVSGAVRVSRENRELWPWLALVALGVLMVEWYVYNRRVYI
jgi:hypothetical protein